MSICPLEDTIISYLKASNIKDDIKYWLLVSIKDNYDKWKPKNLEFAPQLCIDIYSRESDYGKCKYILETGEFFAVRLDKNLLPIIYEYLGDNEEKIVNDLTSKIKHEEITSALLFLSDRGCLCVNGNDGIIIDGTYYEIYRTDKLLRVDMDNAPYGGQYKEYLILDRIDVDNIPAEIYNGQVHVQANIQPYYKSLFVHAVGVQQDTVQLPGRHVQNLSQRCGAAFCMGKKELVNEETLGCGQMGRQRGGGNGTAEQYFGQTGQQQCGIAAQGLLHSKLVFILTGQRVDMVQGLRQSAFGANVQYEGGGGVKCVVHGTRRTFGSAGWGLNVHRYDQIDHGGLNV